MPAIYGTVEDAVTSSTALGTLQSGGSNFACLFNARHGRASTSTTVTGGREYLQRSTGGVTPTNATEEKHNSRSANPQGNIVTAWVTSPSVSGNPLVMIAMGLRQETIDYWIAPRPSARIFLINGEQLDIRSSFTSSSHTVSLHFSDESNQRVNRIAKRARKPGLFSFFCMATSYCHKTATGVYDVNRATVLRWVALIAVTYENRRINWLAYYGTVSGTQFNQALSGGMTTLAGSLQFQTRKVLAGSLSTIVGAQTRQTSKFPSGAVATLVGTLTKSTATAKSGALTTITGAVIRRTGKALSGNIATLTGALVRLTGKPLSGVVVTSTGALTKQTNKGVAGAVATLIGSLSRLKSVLVSLSGALATISGTLTKQSKKVAAGSLTPSAIVVKQISKGVAGSIATITGSLSRLRSVLISLSGAMATLSGTVTKQTRKATAGSLSPSGIVVKQIGKAVAGALNTLIGVVTSLVTAGLTQLRLLQVNAVAVETVTMASASTEQVTLPSVSTEQASLNSRSAEQVTLNSASTAQVSLDSEDVP